MKEPAEDIVSKLNLLPEDNRKWGPGIASQVLPTQIALNELLTTLRKHNVSDYSCDQFGTKVKFAADPTPESAMRVLQRQLEQAIEEPTGKTAPPGPPLRSVEPVPYNLDDILPGGA